MVLYTLGEWRVKSGREEDFIAAWEEFGEWSGENVTGGAWAKLLRDKEDPQKFISFGPWRDEDAVIAWRQNPGFQERVERMQAMLDEFIPHRMSVAAQVGASTPDP